MKNNNVYSRIRDVKKKIHIVNDSCSNLWFITLWFDTEKFPCCEAMHCTRSEISDKINETN